ncbi:hypothetical protein B0T10DRAFT_504545 [Thelonectria olida]|uniref:Uncharacterized protein n=1 Tax=Thelonectria olida TaxID=1576542 RepID=A0A9P8WJ14_9HYPO|nr:hypothetical protein B0T10DRAFT_504545 [Thelonectria olida]
MAHTAETPLNTSADYHVLQPNDLDDPNDLEQSSSTSSSEPNNLRTSGQINPQDSAESCDHIKGSDRRNLAFQNERHSFTTILTNLAAIALPLAFVVFTIRVSSLDGHAVDKETLATLTWRSLMTGLGTLFPILFASVIGRLLFKIARWKLEKGATLGSLEQLMGSQTVGGTLATQYQLRAFNLLGISLVLVWAFSPLGGQSLLRMLDSRLEPRFEPSSIVYFDTDAPSEPANRDPQGSGIEDLEGLLAFFRMLFTAAVLSPEKTKTDPMDLWGNVKIPRLASTAMTGWQNMSWSPKLEHYAAFVGIPVTNVALGNTTFSLESSYIDLECSNITSTSDFPDDGLFDWPGWDATDFDNGTWHGFNVSRGSINSWGIALNRFVDPMWSNRTLVDGRLDNEWYGSMLTRPVLFENETGIEAGPTKLFFHTRIGYDYHGSLRSVTAYCDVAQRYVESRVICSRATYADQQNCSVTAQRSSLLNHPPEEISFFSFPDVFRYISRDVPLATTLEGSVHPSIALQYLNDPDIGSITVGSPPNGFFRDVDDELFSHRLSQVLNTYLLISQMSADSLSSGVNNTEISWNTTTPANVSRLVEVYSVSRLWIWLCLASTVVLLIGGILSVFFNHLANGPEVLGYVSTAVRDSKFIDMPPETGRIGGTDLTMMKKDLRVRYGFTGQESEGQALIGVGLEKETEQIKGHLI